jgi:Uma2 family endonuclease
MLARSPHHRYDYLDYLALDETANVKLEYLAGEIYAMAGGSPEHAALASALNAAIVAGTRNRPCRSHSSDLRIRVLATGLATYPDVSVVCGHLELDPEDPKKHTVTNPVVVCEVLSPSTEDFDRGEKLDSYKLIPSLHHVVLVAHDKRFLEVWSREDGSSSWALHTAQAGQRVHLSAIGVELEVDALYRDPLSTSGFLA